MDLLSTLPISHAVEHRQHFVAQMQPVPVQQPGSPLQADRQSEHAFEELAGQFDEVARQSVHEPAPPDRQVLVVAQYPHPATAVQRSQLLRPPQGSGTGQLAALTVQVPRAAAGHVPALGPLAVPVRHIEEPGHQPQPGVAVHPSQRRCLFATHGSTGSGQLGVSQTQSVQVPPVRPLRVPSSQRPMPHQPQPSWAVQLSQAEKVRQAPVVHASRCMKPSPQAWG